MLRKIPLVVVTGHCYNNEIRFLVEEYPLVSITDRSNDPYFIAMIIVVPYPELVSVAFVVGTLHMRFEGGLNPFRREYLFAIPLSVVIIEQAKLQQVAGTQSKARC